MLHNEGEVGNSDTEEVTKAQCEHSHLVSGRRWAKTSSTLAWGIVLPFHDIERHG